MARTRETLDAVITQLQANCGDKLQAAQYAGISLIFLERWMKDDPEVMDEVQEACRAGSQGLVSEAIRRAVRGSERDVYYKGEVVGQETVYSDVLMNTLLKARVDEFKQDKAPVTFAGPTQINLMPRADNYAQWLEMKTQTLAARELSQQPADPQLPAPDAVEDAEYELVPASVLGGLGI